MKTLRPPISLKTWGSTLFVLIDSPSIIIKRLKYFFESVINMMLRIISQCTASKYVLKLLNADLQTLELVLRENKKQEASGTFVERESCVLKYVPDRYVKDV